MKIAIPAAKDDPQSVPEERFGRTPGFLIYDTTTGQWSYLENRQNYDAPQGAGIQSAGKLVDSGVNAVVSPNLGPKAFAVLQQANIPVYNMQPGTVAQNAAACAAGELARMDGANREDHW